MENKLENAEKELVEARGKVELMEQETQRLNGQNQHFKQERGAYGELQKELASHYDLVADLRDEIDNLKHQLHVKMGELTELKVTVALMQEGRHTYHRIERQLVDNLTQM